VTVAVADPLDPVRERHRLPREVRVHLIDQRDLPLESADLPYPQKARQDGDEHEHDSGWSEEKGTAGRGGEGRGGARGPGGAEV
jgi:hypothetical protein